MTIDSSKLTKIPCDWFYNVYHIRKINNQIWAFGDVDYKAVIARFTNDGIYIDQINVEINTSYFNAYTRGGYGLFENSTQVVLFGYDDNGDGRVAYITKSNPSTQNYYSISVTTGYPYAVMAYPDSNGQDVWIFDNDYMKKFSIASHSFTGTTVGPMNTDILPPDFNCIVHFNQGGDMFAYPIRYGVPQKVNFIGPEGITEIGLPVDPRSQYSACYKKTDENTLWVLTDDYLFKMDAQSQSIVSQYNVSGIYENLASSMGYDETLKTLFWLSNTNGANYPVLVVFDTVSGTVQSESVFPDNNGIGAYTNKYLYDNIAIDGDWWFASNDGYDNTYYLFKLGVYKSNNTGDQVVVYGPDGTRYKLIIEKVLSPTQAQVRLTGGNGPIPPALRNTIIKNWRLAVNLIYNLNNLEGETVSILADGAVHPQRVVTNGTIALDDPASKVQVGLPITADLKTLPLAMQIDGFGQGHYKNVNKAWLRVYRSSGIFVGPDENNLVEVKQRTTEPYDTPPALKSAEIYVLLTPSWQDSGQVFVRQEDPLPLTVVSLTLQVAVGG